MSKPDHERLLDLLQSTPGKYYLTYELRKILGIMDNTVHRALDTIENKMGISIDHKRGIKNVMSYAWLGKSVTNQPVTVPETKVSIHQEIDNLCSACNNSCYYRGKACTKCGALTGRGNN